MSATERLKRLCYLIFCDEGKFVITMWDLRISRRWGWWYCCSSGLWRRVDSSVDANVSEKHTVSIFSPENEDSMFLQDPEEHHHYTNIMLNIVHCLRYSDTYSVSKFGSTIAFREFVIILTDRSKANTWNVNYRIIVKKMQVVNCVQIGLFKVWLRQLGYIPSLMTIHFIIFLFLFFYQ
jgi:hypothetical protein